MKLKYFKKIDFILISLLIVLAFAARLYKINTPLADLHSWRQADTVAVSRNFVRSGINLLKPRYDDLSNIQSGKENPQGLRMVEFPIYNAITALVYKAYPKLPIEIYARLITVFFSLIIIVILYYISLIEMGRLGAFISTLVYSIYPFFVFFSRVALPETTALSFVSISIFILYVSINKRDRDFYFWLFVSSVFFSLGILTKPPVIFYLLPVLYILIKKDGVQVFKKPYLYLFGIVAVFPTLMWRNYIKQYPEGIPAFTWLLTKVNTVGGQKKIFFKPAFFRWIFFERINNLMLGGYLSVFFVLGFLKKYKSFFIYTIVLGAGLYLFTFQGGNVQHEYYQTLILPAIALLIGGGVSFIYEKRVRGNIHSLIISCGVITIFALSWFFSYYNVRNFYNYPESLVKIASIIKNITAQNDKIITDTLGDTTLLFLSDRRGSPSIYKDLDKLIKDGYKYLVVFDKKKIQEFKQNKVCKIVFENNQFAIFSL